MRRRTLTARSLALAGLIAAGTTSTPQTAKAQFVVFDPANLGQAVVDYTMRGLEYAMQGLEYAEAVQGVIHLGRQIQQLDSTFAHMRDAANGRIGQLTQAFADLASADASLLLDADFGAWRNGLTGTSNALAGALGDMDGASLSDYLLNELVAAPGIPPALEDLYPGGAQLAQDIEAGRERGDRVRVADFATAEAGGRLFTLLEEAQTDIDGRRGQGELSHTALQQAQIANQLTAAEIDFALAQLLAIQAQQDALGRHEAELIERQRLADWVQREEAAQDRAQEIADAAAGRSGAYRDAFRLTPRN